MTRTGSRRAIAFGVTIDYQLRYHDGLYQLLADNGWDVHLISGTGPIGDRLGKHPAITVHHVEMKRNPSPVADMRSLAEWFRVLRVVRPQITVVGTPKAGLLGGLAARLSGVSVRVYELHGLRLESVSGWQRWVLKVLEKLACSVATEVFAVGRSLRARALAEHLASETKIQVLGAGSPNGVDIERFSRAACDDTAKREKRIALGVESATPIVAFIGRLTADKGLDVLGQAMIAVERETGAHLLVLGQVDDESGRESVSYLRGLLNNVIFVGDVDDVSPYLAVADVFCLPSRREGLPTVVLEAFAAGVPVVASRATGTVDLVEDGVTGRLVDIDATDQLSSAIIGFLSSRERSDHVTAAARTLVESYYGASTVQNAWVRRLNSLANGGGSKSSHVHPQR